MKEITAQITSAIVDGRVVVESEDFLTTNPPLTSFQLVFTNVPRLTLSGVEGLQLHAGDIQLPIINPYGYNVRCDSLLGTIKSRLPRRLKETSLDNVPANLLKWASTFTVEVKRDNNRIVVLDPLRRTNFVPNWMNVNWGAQGVLQV